MPFVCLVKSTLSFVTATTTRIAIIHNLRSPSQHWRINYMSTKKALWAKWVALIPTKAYQTNVPLNNLKGALRVPGNQSLSRFGPESMMRRFTGYGWGALSMLLFLLQMWILSLVLSSLPPPPYATILCLLRVSRYFCIFLSIYLYCTYGSDPYLSDFPLCSLLSFPSTPPYLHLLSYPIIVEDLTHPHSYLSF